jgi:hypothetical protein
MQQDRAEPTGRWHALIVSETRENRSREIRRGTYRRGNGLILEVSSISGKETVMFESTLEAQALHQGERRLGTLSAAALAHAGIGSRSLR